MTTLPSRRRRGLALVARLALAVVGLAAWLWVALLSVFLVWTTALDPDPFIIWLYDWHVYAAGAMDLVARELYLVPLSFPGAAIPVATYNLPPMSAAWAAPLLVLADHVAGIVWITLGGVAWASAWWLALRLLKVGLAWAWTGVALAAYSLAFYWFGANLLLGNINHLVLGILSIFVVASRAQHSRASGLLLGLAIATKLWPITLLVPLARERRWHDIAWAVGTAGATTAALLLWIGPSAIAPMIAALQLRVPIEDGVAVLWTSAFRIMWDWWPAWGGIATALVLLALPIRGLAGIGVAIIAGISVIPNIWDHYLPTLIFAGLLVATATRFRVVKRAPVRWTSKAAADGV